MHRKAAVIGLIIICLQTGVSQAAPDPGFDLKRSSELSEYYKQEAELRKPKPADTANVVDNTQQIVEDQQQDTIIIHVNKINVDKSEILSAAEIGGITAKYEGREVKPSELYQAVREINELYRAKKYITAKAILPPQTITDGIVRIQLIEGRFGEFQLESKHTNHKYVTDRIVLKKGDLVKLDQLQNDIYYFNATNDIKLQAELKPGKEHGTTDCVLHLEEPERWQSILFSDNAGRRESGQYRIGAVFTNASLFGNREALVISPVWTKGTLAGSVSYSFPVNLRGTRLGISYSKNQVDIISGPYETMDIQGDSSDVGISLTNPVVVEPKKKVETYLDLHRRISSTDVSGTSWIASEIKTAAAGLTFRTVDDKGVWFSQYSLTYIDANQKNLPKNSYSRMNVSAIRQQIINEQEMLVLRFSGQTTADRDLPSSEQFSLGGMSSVKGFAEGLVTGDMGYYIGLEYGFPLQSNKYKGFVFIDHGSTYNRLGNGSHDKNYLTSAGFGVTMNFSKDVFGRIAVGIPLDATKAYDNARIHFLLQSALR